MQTKKPMHAYSPVTPDIAREIEAAVAPARVIRGRERLAELGRDSGEIDHPPELAVEATSTEQVQALLRLACKYRFPVTPRGSGTGLAGGSVPVSGGVVLSLAGMNRILSIQEDNLIAVVEPGVINLDLKNRTREKGLFYPPDPVSLDTSSVGGNAATNAGGPSCIKYGTTKDYILGLEAVLASGEIIEAGVQTRKGVVGYDLVHLLAGSEGTLGVITKLILNLIPHPKSINTMVALFPRITSAMEAIQSTLAGGHVPCAMEFMDRRCLDLVGDLLPFEGLDQADTFLLVEIDGHPESLVRQMEEIGEILMDSGALNVLMAPDSQKRARMWDIRREVSIRIENDSPIWIPEDIVVPIGKIADLVACLPGFERQYGIKIYSFGHAGDGNIHLNITARDTSRRKKVESGIREIIKQVLLMGGTMSGEHGIGIVKRDLISLELSSESIRIQKGIKKLFDPLMILNPGKIFET